MAKYAVNLTQQPINKMAGDLRKMTEYIELTGYEILSIRQSTVARCDVRIRAKARTLTKDVEGEFDLVLFRFTCSGSDVI